MIKTFNTTRWPDGVREQMIPCAAAVTETTLTIDLSSDCYRAIRAAHREGTPGEGPLNRVEQIILNMIRESGKVRQGDLSRRLKLGTEITIAAILELRRLGRVQYCSRCRAELALPASA